MGDSFAYALAEREGEGLLFNGDDFRRTDVKPALRPWRATSCEARSSPAAEPHARFMPEPPICDNDVRPSPQLRDPLPPWRPLA